MIYANYAFRRKNAIFPVDVGEIGAMLLCLIGAGWNFVKQAWVLHGSDTKCV